MDEQAVLQVFSKVGMILKGHFVLRGLRHSDTYFDKDRVSINPIANATLAAAIASDIKEERVEVVIAPELGAITLGQWIAYHLSALTGVLVESVIAKKDGDSFILRPKNHSIIGKRVLVAEDVLMEGKSVRKVVEVVCRAGGNVVVVATLVNRGGITVKHLAVPKLHSLVNINLETWDEVNCPLCWQGVPINTEVGHGAEFLARTGLIK